MKTILVHTDTGNAEKVNSIATNLKGEGDAIEKGSPDAATKLNPEKIDAANFEAVVSGGLPKVQDIVAGYKKLGIVVHVVGIDDPKHVAAQAKLKADAKAEEERQAKNEAEKLADQERREKAALSPEPVELNQVENLLNVRRVDQ